MTSGEVCTGRLRRCLISYGGYSRYIPTIADAVSAHVRFDLLVVLCALGWVLIRATVAERTVPTHISFAYYVG